MSFRKLFQLGLIGTALLLSAKAADGQPLGGFCQSRPKISSVKYLGKSSGDDQVEVKWTTEAASTCIKFGAGGTNLPLAEQDSFTAPAAAGFEVRVKVKRHFNALDEGAKTTKEIIPAGSNVTTIVNIPRGLAATDPEHYAVTITINSGAATQKRAIVTGNGLPNLSAATQTFETFTSYPNISTVGADCFPDVKITGLTFTSGNGAAPDSLAINWNAATISADCFGPQLFISLSVRARRADGTRFVANFGENEFSQNARSKTVQLGTSNSPVISYKIVVAVSQRFGIELKALDNGSF